MRHNSPVCGALVVAALVAITSNAHAIDVPGAPQQYYSVDANHVDLVSGFTTFSVQDVAIGSAANPLSHSVHSQPSVFGRGARYEDNWFGEINNALNFSHNCPANTTAALNVQAAGLTDFFCLTSGSYVSLRGRGATLTYSSGVYTFTDRSGAVYTFTDAAGRRLTRIRYPNGLQLDYAYTAVPNWRVASITRNDGLQLHYDYATANTPQTYDQITQVVAVNNAFEYCSPTALTCALSLPWRTATYSHTQQPSVPGVYTVTDQAGQTTRFSLNGYGEVVGYRPPSATSDTITYEYCRHDPPYNCYVLNQTGIYITQFFGKVVSVSRAGQPWTYYLQSFPTGEPYAVNWQYSSTNPLGPVRTIVAKATSDSGLSGVIWITNEDGSRADYENNVTTNRLVSDRIPARGTRNYTYDARGNVTQITHAPETGSALPSLIVRAGYAATCANPVICNQPNWVEDANANRTDFTYDPVHGGVLTETGPAVNGIRPQTRRTYVQRYAWYLNSASVQTRAATPIWVLDRESICRSGAASGSGCAVAADEVVTTYEYGPDSGPNNLFLRGRVVSADGQSLRTCYTYDRFGNRISETLPRAGLTSCP